MRRGPCFKKALTRWNGNAMPTLSGRPYDNCAAAVKYWLDRGLCERTALVMADVAQSRFAPLCRDLKEQEEP